MTELTDVAELMRANLAVFDERDPERRRAAIARTYAHDVSFSDAEATITGHEALDARIAALHAGLPPTAHFRAEGPLYVGAGEAALAWALAPEGEAPIAHGVDFGTFADGRIATLRTLLAPPAAPRSGESS
jgi:SnoaL-like domain